MTQLEHIDVVICGSGIVGAVLACRLADSPLRVLLVDRQPVPAALQPAPRPAAPQPVAPQPAAPQPAAPQPATPDTSVPQAVDEYSPRVSALNLKSINVLQRVDVFARIPRFCSFDRMVVRDSRGSSSIEFSAADAGETQLGCIVENERVTHALLERLAAASNIEVAFDTEISEIVASSDGYRLHLGEHRELEAGLLVGADGGNSHIRKLAGLRKLRWQYDQQAVVATIRTESSHGRIARQWFTEEGPLALLPLPDDHLCSIVWSSSNADVLLGLDGDAFCERLGLATEAELGCIEDVGRRYSFPLAQQHVLRYVKPGLALIGDAAHVIHPLAGQGANLGIADADCLASELRQAILNGEAPGSLKVLNRYVVRRQPQNLLVAAVMEAFTQLYGTGNPAVNWLRNTGMKWVNGADSLKLMVMRLAR